jgi:hypothetical protein
LRSLSLGFVERIAYLQEAIVALAATIAIQRIAISSGPRLAWIASRGIFMRAHGNVAANIYRIPQSGIAQFRPEVG